MRHDLAALTRRLARGFRLVRAGALDPINVNANNPKWILNRVTFHDDLSIMTA